MKKMTAIELKQYVIAESKKLMKAEMLKEEKNSIIGQLKRLDENEFGGDFDTNSREVEYGVNPESEEFILQGIYTVSNTGGYEIMLSDDGDSARVRDAFGSDNPKTSDWLEIEYVVDDEADPEDGHPAMMPVIDPKGYNIPLNMVMRINR